MKKVRASIVPYLNARPFLHGLERSGLLDEMDLMIQEPALGAVSLQTGEVDLALAPVAIMPLLPEHHIVSDYAIACDGPVGSVAVFAHVPIEELHTIQLDVNSMTSNALLRVLVSDYWQLNVSLVAGTAGEPLLSHGEGVLLIGNRAMKYRSRFACVHDLGEAWKHHTGLPFVFALWLSAKPLPGDFVTKFSAALELGIQEIPQLKITDEEMVYLRRQVKYKLNDGMRLALDKFLAAIR